MSRFSLVAAYRDRIWKCRGRRGCVGTGINIEDNFPRVLSLWILRKTQRRISRCLSDFPSNSNNIPHDEVGET